MEVIKPVDFSSFAAFCEHLNTNTAAKAKAMATATTMATSATTTVSPTATARISQSPDPAPNLALVQQQQQQQQTQINGNIYVEKMERQGKMEMAAKERESQRLQFIPKKWNHREEYEFLRVLTGYGIDLQPASAMMPGTGAPTPDWTKFKQMAHLERKSDETLSDYYKVFVAMCKRQAGVKLNENERGLEGIIEEISEDHAKLILDRLELLSKLREIARHPQLEKRLKLCMKNADTPDWWEPGRHDKELIAAVLKHGLYRSETFIFNDQTFSFAESEKRFIRELEAQIQRSIKLEAFNAEKASQPQQPPPPPPPPSTTPTSSKSDNEVKTEIIDLDDELLTKNSLIKKENFSLALKEEVKCEPPISSEEVTSKIEESKDSVENKAEALSEKENKTEEPKSNGETTESKTETSEKIDISSEADKSENEAKKKETCTAEDELQKESEKSDKSDINSEEKQVDEESMATEETKDLAMAMKSGDVNESETVEADKKPSTEEESKDIKESDGTTRDDQEKNVEKEIVGEEKESSSEKEIIAEDDPEKTEIVKDTKISEETASTEKSNASNVINETSEPKEPHTTVEKEDERTEVTIKSKAKESISNTENKMEETALDLAAATEVSSSPQKATSITVPDDDEDEIMKEKEKAVEEECKKQAAELKARFPDLEVIQPATVKQKLERPKLEMCMIRWFKDFALERRIAHIVTCVETSKWPVDVNYSAFAGCKGLDLNIGLHEAIPHLNTIERRSTTPDVITITTDQGVTKHLPASQMQQVAGAAAANAAAVGSSVGTVKGGVGNLDSNSLNAAMAAAVAAAAGSPATALPNLLPGMSMTATNVPSILTNATGNAVNNSTSSAATTPSAGGKKRKRHIAIDVETERAKLHALLNSSQGMGPKDWETEIANMEALSAVTATPAGRRSANTAVSPASAVNAASMGNLQPPPAHQHGLSRQNSGQFNKPAIPPMKTPPPSMGAPMDLSSSLPKMNMTDMLKSASNVGAIDLSEVQDFSMSSKKSSVNAALSSAFPSLGGGKSKLDDTLNKLMKKNNCTIEEPVVGIEKKRKKLDEIVLGLSAAKEQKTFPDPSLPSSKKPQIPPSVSVTPANVPSSMSNQSQSNQKPFTITVTTVPGKSKGGSSNSNMSSSSAGGSNSNSGISALQNMTMGGLSSKDSLNALLAQTMATDPQTFLKQQQKMIQCLPPAQRKIYENMLAEMEQAMKMTAKYNPHDVKVNKWLSDMSTPLNDQLSMEYGSGSSSTTSSRRSGRQSNASQQQQSSAAQQMSKSSTQSPQMHQQPPPPVGPQGLTGEEPVPVINKQTGKRLTGNKAPQLKRLMQWLTENPQYEVDPKWLEQMQNPMPAPSPKPTAMDTGYSNSSKSHGGRPSSTSSNASSSGGGGHSQMQSQSAASQSSSSASSSSKKSSRQSAIDQANAAMQFGSLAGLNPNLLASLPGFGAFDPKNPLGAFDPKNPLASLDPKNSLAGFDPKNPLLSMPFAGMPGMGNIPGLGNLNNMNLFASLAGMGGLGNLAGMDAQSLAALMAAAGPSLTGLTGASGSGGGNNSGGSGKGNLQSSGSSNKKNKQQANEAAAQLAAANAAVLAGAAGNSGSGGSNNSSSKNAAANSAAQLAAGLPFLFPNSSLLYPPMGLSGLNPYSLGSTGLGSAYDQLAQQYNLLNGGGAVSSAGTSSTTQSKSHQSQSKSNSSRSSNASSSAALMNAMASMSGGSHGGVGGGNSSSNQSSSSQQSSRNSGRQSAASRAQAQASAEMAQLSNLLMPGADPHLLESLSRMAGMDLAQATRLMNSLGMPPVPNSTASSDKRSSANSAASNAAAAQAAKDKQVAKVQQKWMESVARGVIPTDWSTLQAFAEGKLFPFPGGSGSGSNTGSNSSSSGSASSKSAAKAAAAAAAAAAAQLPQIPGMPGDFSQAFLAEITAQAMAGTLPLTGPGSLASLAGLTAPPSGSSSTSSSSSSKRQREQDALKQQMDFYTKALGLGSGISLIPTSMSGSSASSSSLSASLASGMDDGHKSSSSSKRLAMDAAAVAHASQAASLKADEMTAAALAASGLPLSLGGGMTSIEKSLRGSSNNNNSSASNSSMQPPSSSSASASDVDKVTLTPLNSAGIAANLPSQTTITIAPPISSGASSSSERSERSESRISLTITNAADAAKMPMPYEEADELIIQPILKKPSSSSAGGPASNNNSHEEHHEAASSCGGSSSGGGVNASNAATSAGAGSSDTESRRSSTRLKRPRSGADHSIIADQPPEKRRELRSTRHTRQSSGGNPDASLNLSTSGDEKE